MGLDEGTGEVYCLLTARKMEWKIENSGILIRRYLLAAGGQICTAVLLLSKLLTYLITYFFMVQGTS